MFNAQEFGKRLKKIRKDRGISQKRLSELTGISIQTISSYETGHSFPVIDYIYQIGLILNVSIDYLLYGNEETINLVNDNNISDIKKLVKSVLSLLDTNLVTIDVINSPFFPKCINLKILDTELVSVIEGIKKYVDEKNNLDESTYRLIINSYLDKRNKKL